MPIGSGRILGSLNLVRTEILESDRCGSYDGAKSGILPRLAKGHHLLRSRQPLISKTEKLQKTTDTLHPIARVRLFVFAVRRKPLVKTISIGR